MRTLRRCLRCPHAVADTELFCPRCEERINDDLAAESEEMSRECGPFFFYGVAAIILACIGGAVYLLTR